MVKRKNYSATRSRDVDSSRSRNKGMRGITRPGVTANRLRAKKCRTRRICDQSRKQTIISPTGPHSYPPDASALSQNRTYLRRARRSPRLGDGRQTKAPMVVQVKEAAAKGKSTMTSKVESRQGRRLVFRPKKEVYDSENDTITRGNQRLIPTGEGVAYSQKVTERVRSVLSLHSGGNFCAT